MEEFRAIKDFPAYSVSSFGRVRNARGDILRPGRNSNGYLLARLGGAKHGKSIGVHVLVLEAFICQRPHGLVVNHKNSDRSDNRVENLEWVTQSENVLHAYANGRRVIDQAHRDRCALLGAAKRTWTDATARRIRNLYTGRRGQITAIANQLQVSRYIVAYIIGKQA